MSLTIEGFTNQRATITRRKKGPYGDTPPETVVEWTPCRFVDSGEVKWDKTIGGEITIGAGQAWFDGDICGIMRGDLLLLEEKQQFTVVKITKQRDLDGRVDHTKVVVS